MRKLERECACAPAKDARHGAPRMLENETGFYLRTAQAISSGCLPGENCPTTSSVFKSTTTILSAVLTAT